MSQKETSAVGAKTCPAIEMRGITKIYPNGVVANQGVDFSVNYGEIHAVMGENGAGKSTLMKMLFGMERPDQGEILFEGKPVQIHSPADAIALHIGGRQRTDPGVVLLFGEFGAQLFAALGPDGVQVEVGCHVGTGIDAGIGGTHVVDKSFLGPQILRWRRVFSDRLSTDFALATCGDNPLTDSKISAVIAGSTRCELGVPLECCGNNPVLRPVLVVSAHGLRQSIRKLSTNPVSHDAFGA